MGVINHNAIIATTWSDGRLIAMQKWLDTNMSAKWRPQFVVAPVVVNSGGTIIFAPDGSKEGWGDSNDGDAIRDEFYAKLQEGNHDDGSSPWSVVEIGFGEFGAAILRHNCRNLYNDKPYAEDL